MKHEILLLIDGGDSVQGGTSKSYESYIVPCKDDIIMITPTLAVKVEFRILGMCNASLALKCKSICRSSDGSFNF